MNGINTELAKNLILSGTNITIADSELINEDDVETNFMIAPSDIGQVVNQILKTYLSCKLFIYIYNIIYNSNIDKKERRSNWKKIKRNESNGRYIYF